VIFPTLMQCPTCKDVSVAVVVGRTACYHPIQREVHTSTVELMKRHRVNDINMGVNSTAAGEWWRQRKSSR